MKFQGEGEFFVFVFGVHFFFLVKTNAVKVL